MDRENPLDPYAKRRFSYGEGFSVAAALPANDGSLEHLNPFLLAFHDFDMDANRVADLELRNLLFHKCGLDSLEPIHDCISSLRSPRPSGEAWPESSFRVRRSSAVREARSNKSGRFINVLRNASARRHASMALWLPDKRTTGTFRPRNSYVRVTWE